jgi:hypothetical protein
VLAGWLEQTERVAELEAAAELFRAAEHGRGVGGVQPAIARPVHGLARAERHHGDGDLHHERLQPRCGSQQDPPGLAVDEVAELVEDQQSDPLAEEQRSAAAHAIGHRAASWEGIAELVQQLVEDGRRRGRAGQERVQDAPGSVGSSRRARAKNGYGSAR